MNNNNGFYFQIKSLTQLPDFDYSISPLPWKPCAYDVFKHYSQETISRDPLFGRMARFFLQNNIISNTELCHNTSFCHPLYYILLSSNRSKLSLPNTFINQHIHDLPMLSGQKHRRQHFLKNFMDL
jgi:hypothetical protein